MNVLDLFSGIGGFSLGLERAGMRTVAFCEIDPYCRAVLRKHWPTVVQFTDVRLLSRDVLDVFGIPRVDVVCGGFPCQDISFAGKGAGLDGERSGLWREYHRIINEVRPRYAIIENVAALRSRGLDAVLGSLAAIGYDAEWHCIPASAVGAPHRRDRIWIVAANTHGARLPVGCQSQLLAQLPTIKRSDWRLTEPPVCRADDGVPDRVDRIRALGNAVVPQIPEIIGRALMRASF